MNGFNYRPRPSIGTTRDPFTFAVNPTNPAAYNTSGSHGGDLPASVGHDWTGFDNAFGGHPPASSIAPTGAPVFSPGANTLGRLTMNPAEKAGFDALAPGQGRIIQPRMSDNGVTLYSGNPANVGKSMAMTIPEQYRTPGASPIATATVGAQTVNPAGVAGPIVQPKGLSEAMMAKYPNVMQQGHADNKAFVDAYTKAYDPAKPMSVADAMGIADGLFNKSSDQPIGGLTATQPKGPGTPRYYNSPENEGDPGQGPGTYTPPPSAGTKAANAITGTAKNVGGAIAGTASSAATNAHDFVSGLIPGWDNAVGGAYDTVANWMGAGPKQYAQPAPAVTPKPQTPQVAVTGIAGLPPWAF